MEALTRYLDHRISGSPDSVALEAGIFFKAFWGLFCAICVCLRGSFCVCAARGDAAAALSFRLHLHPAAHGQRQSMAVGGGVDFGTILLAGIDGRGHHVLGIAGVALPLSSDSASRARLTTG